MKWLLVLNWLLWVISPWISSVSAAEKKIEPFSSASEQCTVRFENIPLNLDDLRTTVPEARFVSEDLKTIRKLVPSIEGLFLIRVGSLDRTPIYGSYWAEEQDARIESLPGNFSSLTETRVTEQDDLEELQKDVMPGYYRAVLRYYPPLPDRASSKKRWRRKHRRSPRVLLCEAISPAMELDRPINLFLFK